MQALILAAGKGSRLSELTEHDTKCMVEVNGKKLIDHSLETLVQFPISCIVMVIGYKGNRVQKYLGNRYKHIPIEYVYNPVYDTTNNIYSLYLAKEYLEREDTIVLESDLIFEKKVIAKLLSYDKSQSIALVEKYQAWMDGTVVEVNFRGEIKSFISKKEYNYQNIDKYYKTVNIYKFTSDFSTNHYVPFLEAYCKSSGLNEYYENVLKIITFIDKGCITVAKLEEGEKWYEIDDKQDLDNAETIFSEDIVKYQNRYGGYWRFPNLKDFCYLVNPYFPPRLMQEEFKYMFNTLLEEYPSTIRVQNSLAAKMFDVNEKHILVGNGAAELISALMNSLNDKKIGIVYPTFEEYPARCQDNIVALYPENENYSYGVNDLKTLVDKCDTLLLINPDNPSGNFIPKLQVLEIIDYVHKEGKSIIVDESFVDFSSANEANTIIDKDIIEQYTDLVIIKSISKSYGVPGIRLGVMISQDKDLYQSVSSKISVWNINSFGEFFLQIIGKYKDDYRNACRQIAMERDRFFELLKAVPYLRPIPSQANYFLCQVQSKFTASELTKLLMKNSGILIKDCSTKNAFKNKEFIRIAVRNQEDNDYLISSLKQLI